MTGAQVLARELVEIGRWLETRLDAQSVATDAVREEVGRAGRLVTALGALVGLAPRIEVTPAAVEVPRAGGKSVGDRCPKCGEKLRLVPTAGFGTTSRDICGVCGHEPAAA